MYSSLFVWFVYFVVKKEMNRTLLCLVLLLSACAAAAADPRGWQLLWSDEFDGPAVDESKWRIEDAALNKNNERQYYAPDDAYIQDGCLVLRSQRRAMGGREYTSGLLETRDKFALTFGRIEIRAKLPRTQGLWPAHWLLPDDGSWPPEIDIMEYVGSQPNVITMSLHNGSWPDLDSQSGDYMGPDYSADFHTFALEWEPKEIRWLIDGVTRFSTTEGVPSIPMFIILNTAVGGHMPGDPDETTVLPQFHLIDYVRVYCPDVQDRFYLIASTEHGRVFASPKACPYEAGTQVTLTAYPSIGYKFDHWTGDIEGDDNPARVSMTGHRNIRAVFVEDPAAPILLSRDKPVKASSVEKPDCAPENATDGNPATRWSSQFADPQSITIDLGEVHPIEAIRLVWETAHAKDYMIDVSKDGKTWTNVHSKKNCRGRTEDLIGLKCTGRYVRMTGLTRAGEWGYSLWEFEVFGR